MDPFSPDGEEKLELDMSLEVQGAKILDDAQRQSLQQEEQMQEIMDNISLGSF